MRIRYLFLSAVLSALPALESHACRITKALTQEDRDRADLVVFGTPVSYNGDVLELAVEETFKGTVSTETVRIRMIAGIAWRPPQDMAELARFGRRVGVGATVTDANALPELLVPACTVGYMFGSAGGLELFGYGTPESVERERIESWGEKLNEAGFRSVDEAEVFLTGIRRIAVRRDQAALDAIVDFRIVPDEDQWKALETVGLKDLRLFSDLDPPRAMISRREFDVPFWVARIDGDLVLTRR